ncbi:MAG: PEP-CTERM sorting domain-containing protein [Kiritimatiellae bacterium]|nr:PEP-CTERM sorting domain-containing protein [Kiritimatiellia bacterium]
MKKWQTIFTMIGGFILPVAAFVLGMLIGDDDSFLNVMPTVIHKALVFSVPVINLAIWICLRRGSGNRNLLRALCGFSVGVSAVYTVMLLPLVVIGLIGFCLMFWYFGVGFLGLIACAPATALASGLIFRSRLAAVDAEKCDAKAGGFSRGLLAAAVIWVFMFCDAGLACFGCNTGMSSDPAVAARGIRIARMSFRTDIIRSFCRNRGFVVFYTVPLANRNASFEAFDLLYYRITGENPVYMRNSWGRRRAMLSWDWIAGGEKVGGILEGLSLKGSAYDTTVDNVAGIGYGEWTMTFANAKTWGEEEARCRIALPPGGVVSRLTLWINGEECEAAFGTKGLVRRAYESVVRRRRDPVLVNICGPDQVQMQCFPVPHEGEMKVRIGITFPLNISLDGKGARLPCPVITSRNFSVPSDLIGLPAPETFAFKTSPAVVAVCTNDANGTLNGTAIVQKSSLAPLWEPERIAFVIDTSAAMRPHMSDVLATLANAKAPDEIEKEFWFTGDIPPEKPLSKLPDSVTCRGGRPALATLVKALDALAANGDSAALVWIHAGEPVSGQTGDALALKLRKAANVKFFICQVAEGECALTEPIPPSAKIVSLTSDALSGGVGPALERFFGGWAVRLVSSREKVALADVPQGAVPASDHLGRLWAAEETARIFRDGDPVALEKAQKTALPWHIVTAATGAVVLESKQQYKENDLEPVDAHSVPTVPEPSALLCLVIVAVVFVLARKRKMVDNR